jgi:hypothetical protein
MAYKGFKGLLVVIPILMDGSGRYEPIGKILSGSSDDGMPGVVKDLALAKNRAEFDAVARMKKGMEIPKYLVMRVEDEIDVSVRATASLLS